MKIVITRTAYCAQCAQAERPKTGDVFVVNGSRGYHVHAIEYAAKHTNIVGFVPHIFQLDKSADGFIHGTKTCCMNKCGYDVRENPKYETGESNKPYLLYTNYSSPFKMTIADWNALVLTKDFGYRVD